MKKIILFALFNLALYAQGLESLTTFSADFTQTLQAQMGDKQEVITYKGQIKAKAPANVLWIYKSPVPKEIYITNNEMIVYEPKLRQAIITQMQESLDLLTLLKKAKKLNNTEYETQILDQKYQLKIQGKILKEINFVDSLDNKVRITFSNAKIDEYIDSKVFDFLPSSDIDVIHP